VKGEVLMMMQLPAAVAGALSLVRNADFASGGIITSFR
jgi:hypothetical protein